MKACRLRLARSRVAQAEDRKCLLHNRAGQKFAPSCVDAHERLSQRLWRHPMFGAIFHEIRSWPLFYSPWPRSPSAHCWH